MDRLDQPFPLVSGELGERGVRRELRPMQDVVGVAATDAGDRALVAQDRVDATGVVARAEQLVGLGTRSFRAELRRAGRRRRARAPTSRPCAPSRTPSRARWAGRALGTAAPAPRGFVDFGGASTSTRPPCERCTSIRRPSSSSNTRYFPRRVTRSIERPSASAGCGANVFSDENCSRSSASSVAPASTSSSRSASACTSGISGIARPTQRAPRQPSPRSRCTRRCGRGACGGTRCRRAARSGRGSASSTGTRASTR